MGALLNCVWLWFCNFFNSVRDKGKVVARALYIRNEIDINATACRFTFATVKPVDMFGNKYLAVVIKFFLFFINQ